MDWLKGGSYFNEKNIKERQKVVGFKSLRKPLKEVEHQTGTTHKKRDKVRKAMPPGKRISKTGKVYYEYRKNRTDLKGNI